MPMRARAAGRLGRETSVYLDLVRIAAVILVFLSHAKRPDFGSNSTLLATLGQYGQEGVALFFVISGVVIAHVATTRERDVWDYAVARLSRLWSVVIPAILLTVVLDTVGRRIDPRLYDNPLIPAWGFNLRSLWQALAPALFVNQIPGLRTVVGTNGPFWSLCFEAWYYLSFACLVLARIPRWGRLGVAIILCLVAGPDIVIMASIWIAGNLTYHVLGRTRPGAAAWIVWILSSLAIPLVLLAKYHLARLIGEHGAGLSPSTAMVVVEDFIPATLLITNLVSFDAISANFGSVLAHARPGVKYLANRSFSLYLFQAPVLFFLGALTHAIYPRRLGFFIVVCGCLAACLALSELTEQRRPALARWIRSAPQWGGRVLRRSVTASGADGR